MTLALSAASHAGIALVVAVDVTAGHLVGCSPAEGLTA